MKRRHAFGWYLTLAALLLLAGTALLFRQGIGRYVAARALGFYAPRLGVSVSYDSITGDIYTRPAFHGLRVGFAGDSLSCRRLDVSYDPFGFLQGRIPLSAANIREPVVYLTFPMAAQTGSAPPAQRPSYPNLDLKRLRIADGRVFVNGVERVDSLELALTVASRPELLRARLSGVRCRLVQERVSVRGLSTRCRLSPDSLVLEDLAVATAQSRMNGDLRLSLDGKAVSARMENLSVILGEFTDLPGRFTARGEGAIAGPSRKADLRYSASGLVFGTIELPDVSGRLAMADSLFRLELAGRDERLGGVSLSGRYDARTMTFDAEVELADVNVSRLARALPDLRISGRARSGGRLAGRPAGQGLGPDTLWLSLAASAPEIGVDSLVLAGGYCRDRWQVRRLESRGASGRLWLAGDYRRGTLGLQGLLDSADLGLLEPFVRVAARGRASGVFACSGRTDSLVMTGGVRVKGFAAGDVRFEDGLAEFAMTLADRFTGHAVVGCEGASVGDIRVAAAQVQFDGQDFDLRVDRPADRLLARGSVELGREMVQARVDYLSYTAEEESVTAGRPFAVTWRPESLTVGDGHWHIADGTVAAELAVAAGGVRAELDGEGLNLRKLQKLAGLPAELWGTVDFRFAGTDTFDIRLAARDLGVPDIGLVIKSAGVEARASGERAELGRLWFVHDVETTSVTGRLEYVTRGGLTLTDLELTAALADPGPWVLFFIKQIIDLKDGRVYGQATLRGGIEEPNLVGRLRVVDGTVFIPSVQTTVDRVEAEITAARDRVTVEKLAGGSGRGMVTASGFVDLGTGWNVDSLRFRIRPEAASINPLPEVFAIASGDLSIAWRPAAPLSIDGTVHVEEALLAFGFGEPSAAPAAPDAAADSVVYDVRVTGERGIWLRNQLADIELGVDLAVRRTMTEQLYTGQFTTRQGRIYYLDHTLQVAKGEIRFDNIGTLNPALDIVAELPVRNRDHGATVPDRVLLTLAGTLSAPEFRLGAEPAVWDDNQILTYLSLNVTPEELAAIEGRQAMTRYLSERLLGYFQTQATKQLRRYVGLDELRLESALAGNDGYRVTVGKYIGRDIYVSYTQNFTGTVQPAFTVEYFLNNRSEIVGAKTEEGRYSLRYRFKLKY